MNEISLCDVQKKCLTTFYVLCILCLVIIIAAAVSGLHLYLKEATGVPMLIHHVISLASILIALFLLLSQADIMKGLESNDKRRTWRIQIMYRLISDTSIHITPDFLKISNLDQWERAADSQLELAFVQKQQRTNRTSS